MKFILHGQKMGILKNIIIEREVNKMTKEKETTIFFADGTHADVYRHGRNEYSIYFDYTESTVYGSYLDVAMAIEDYKEKMMNSNKKDNEENHPMTSYGNCMNLWTTGGDYDVFIIMHEAESQDNFERIVDCNVEDTCHTIMQNNNLSVKEKKEIIKTVVDAYTDYGIQVIIAERK